MQQGDSCTGMTGCHNFEFNVSRRYNREYPRVSRSRRTRSLSDGGWIHSPFCPQQLFDDFLPSKTFSSSNLFPTTWTPAAALDDERRLRWHYSWIGRLRYREYFGALPQLSVNLTATACHRSSRILPLPSSSIISSDSHVQNHFMDSITSPYRVVFWFVFLGAPTRRSYTVLATCQISRTFRSLVKVACPNIFFPFTFMVLSEKAGCGS